MRTPAAASTTECEQMITSRVHGVLEPVLERVARHVVYPLADAKNGSDRLHEAARLRASQWWPRPQLDALRNERLARIARHAMVTVPFYREHWHGAPVPATIADLAAVPLVRKQHLREHRERMLAESVDRHSLISAKTGGSTGTSLHLMFDDACQQRRNAAAIRSDEWAGWKLGASVGALWGNPPVPATARARLRSVLHQRMRFLDTMRLDDVVVGAFVQALRESRTRVLFGHAHSLFRFAESVQRQGLEPPPLRGIVSTSMMLIRPERELIERVLRCRVTDRYGCEEVGLIASECERHDGFHVNEEHVVVELVDADGRAVAPGEMGLVCVTDLNNYAMPLIRYVVEDLAIAMPEPCVCGRALARLERIVGRTADFLKRADGALVAGVSLVERTLTAIPGIAQLQLVQDAPGTINANLVPDRHFDDDSARRLVNELRAGLGQDICVTVTKMGELPREANGKYRFAICRC